MYNQEKNVKIIFIYRVIGKGLSKMISISGDKCVILNKERDYKG